MTETPRGETLKAGDRLPLLELHRPSPKQNVRWSEAASVTIVLFFAIEDPEADQYLAALREQHRPIRHCDGRVLLVPALETESREPVSPPFEWVVDPGGSARRQCGVGSGEVGLFLVDRWRQIYLAEVARSTRELSAPPEIEEWLLFVKMQCPECGVPDVPSGS